MRTEISARELGVAILGSCLLAVLMSWPLATRLSTHVPYDTGDPVLTTWEIAWGGHALKTGPAGIFQANIFKPSPDTFAFTDSLIGLAPFSVFGNGPATAIARHGVFWIAAYAVALLGAYLLARELGMSPWAAAIAGVAFAYAPFRLSHGGHIHVLWSGGVPLSLFLLVRGYRRVRWWPVLAGWIVASWQITIGWNVGLPFAYLVAGLAIAALLVGARKRALAGLGRPVVAASIAGVLLFAGTGAWLSRPYQRVVEAEPQVRRDLATVALFSPSLYGLVSAPKEARLWGATTEPFRKRLNFAVEQSILPGVVVVALAAWGLVLGAWPRWLRFSLAGAAILFTLLSLGVHATGPGRFYPYRLLFEYAPGFQGLRTPARMMTFTALALGLLAAAGAEFVTDRRKAFLAGLAALIALEGLGAPIPTAEVPERPAGIEAAGDGLQVHLPMRAGSPSEALYMLWTTDRFPPMLNGYSGLVPQRLRTIQPLLAGFPDETSVNALRVLGVRTVVLYPQLAAGTPWQDAAGADISGLPLTRRNAGDVVVFDLT